MTTPSAAWRVGLLLCVAQGLLGCADGSDGAVSVRWRIVDKTFGQVYDPRSFGAADGSCQCAAGQGACASNCGFQISKVKLDVWDVSGGTPVPVDVPDQYTLFDCRVGEATTPFRIPVGEQRALGLAAYDPSNPSGMLQATTPPPVVRAIRHGEIVNLDVVELAVDLRSIPFGGCAQ